MSAPVCEFPTTAIRSDGNTARCSESRSSASSKDKVRAPDCVIAACMCGSECGVAPWQNTTASTWCPLTIQPLLSACSTWVTASSTIVTCGMRRISAQMLWHTPAMSQRRGQPAEQISNSWS
eukprot:858018-Rhodomonas_salina.6